MYKDKEKQKEAVRLAVKKYRQGITQEGITSQGITSKMIETPEGPKPIGSLPDNYGQDDCQCRHCHQNRYQGLKHLINHGAYKTAGELASNEINRVTLPGDRDYKR